MVRHTTGYIRYSPIKQQLPSRSISPGPLAEKKLWFPATSWRSVGALGCMTSLGVRAHEAVDFINVNTKLAVHGALVFVCLSSLSLVYVCRVAVLTP